MSSTDDGLPNPKVVPIQTLLFWDGNSGCAHIDDMDVPLKRPPVLSTVRLVRYLQYSPHTHLTWVRESGQKGRPMTARECAEAQAILERIRDAADDAATQPGALTP